MKKHKTLFQVLILTLIGILVFCIIIPQIFVHIAETLLTNTGFKKLLQEEASPDGEHIAYVIGVYPGATEEYNCQILILNKYTRFSVFKGGNVYIGPLLDSVKWESDNKLVAYYSTSDEDCRGFLDEPVLQKNEYKGIEIEYRIDTENK